MKDILKFASALEPKAEILHCVQDDKSDSIIIQQKAGNYVPGLIIMEYLISEFNPDGYRDETEID